MEAGPPAAPIDLPAILATAPVVWQTPGDEARDPGGERVAGGAGCVRLDRSDARRGHLLRRVRPGGNGRMAAWMSVPP
jgi:hypothetical protein